MRARERERFLRLNYTPQELEIRDGLYKNRKLAKYKIRITEEHYDKKRSFAYGKPTYSSYLTYFTDFPEEGTYLDTIYFYKPSQFENIMKLYEGMFYELFDLETGERIGYGSLDPDSPVEEIREHFKCNDVCELCFWRGMIWGEKKTEEINGNYFCTCYHPKERKVWERELEHERKRCK